MRRHQLFDHARSWGRVAQVQGTCLEFTIACEGQADEGREVAGVGFSAKQNLCTDLHASLRMP